MSGFVVVYVYSGKILHVGGDQQFQTIQAAINASVNGDVVFIHAGLYSGPGNVNLVTMGRQIVVLGEAQGAVVIDVQNNGRGFNFSETGETATVIGRLTIQKASASAIYVNAATVTTHATVYESTLRGCSASNGGGVTATGAKASASLGLCTFTDNNATTSGAAAFADKSGAVTLSYCVANSPNVAVKNSYAAVQGGGSLSGNYCEWNGSGKVPHAFTDDFSTGFSISGGTFHHFTSTAVVSTSWYMTAEMVLASARFALNPDAVSVAGAALIMGCTFVSNNGVSIATADGGHHTLIASCTFTNNKNTAIRAYSSTSIDDCTFTGNKGTSGGAIEVRYTDVGDVFIERNVFDGNPANYGGAIYFDGCWQNSGTNYKLQVTDALFLNNKATINGGAIYTADPQQGWSYPVYPVIKGATFIGNSAVRGGAAYFSQPGTISYSILGANSATYGNQLSAGGAGNGTIQFCDVTNSASGIDDPGGHLNSGKGFFIGGNGNIDADPQFVAGPRGPYYLSQIAAGQGYPSPCTDPGPANLGALVPDLATASGGFSTLTTRTDGVKDSATLDMGYHYAP